MGLSETYKISIVVEGNDKASGPLGRVSNSLGSIGTIAGGILSANFLTGIANGIADITKQALDGYASYERLGMALTSLTAREIVNNGQASSLGEAWDIASQKAAELQGWVQQLAIKSPFKQSDIAGAFKQAMAYGFTTDQAQRLTVAMVDFSSATGASGDIMDRISLALGQIRARGKLAGQEINQLTETGIPVRQILAKSFGVTTGELETMISKGLVPANKAIAAITTSLEQDFGGAAEKQANTFSGLISSLQDIKEVGLREFFSGTFQAVQPYLQSFVDTMSSPEMMTNIKAIGGGIGNFAKNAIEGLKLVSDYFGNLFGAISDAGVIDSGKLTSEFKEAFTAFMPQDVQGPVMGFLDGLLNLFNGIGKFWTEQGPVITAIATNLFTTLKQNAGGVLQGALTWLQGAFTSIGAWFSANGTQISMVLAAIGAAIGFISTAVANLWPILQTLLDFALRTIMNLGSAILKMLTGDMPGAFENFKLIFLDIFITLQATLEGIAVWVLQSFFGTNIDDAKKKIDTFTQGIRDGFDKVKQTFIDLKTKFKEFLDSIVNAVVPDWAKKLLGIGTVDAQRAIGGPVTAGKTYLVGERGPELFTPPVSGNIVPNNKLFNGNGGNITTNNRTFNISVNNYGKEVDENSLASAIERWEFAYGF